MCGIIGVFGSPEAARMAALGMFAEQHRGQESCGMAVSDGKVIRLIFPELNEERRKELVKVVKKKGEESKVAIRAIRRDANEQIKKEEKDKLITEDDRKALDDKV